MRQLFKTFVEKISHRSKGRSASRQKRRAPFRLESLEARNLMSATPILFQTVREGVDYGNTRTAAQVSALSQMMETKVTGKLSGGGDVDVFKVSLRAGDMLTVDTVFATIGTTTKGEVALLNNAGPLANVNQSGTMREFRADKSGDYFVQLARGDKLNSSPLGYTLHLRSIGLADGSLNPTLLNQSGGSLYAFLTGDTASTVKNLNITGPVGHGFSVSGNWTETHSNAGANLVSATYTASGTVHLQTPLGHLDMTIPAGASFSLTTKPQPFGEAFGEIDSLNWSATINTAGLASAFGLTGAMAIDLSALPPTLTLSMRQGNWAGVNLGASPILQNTGAPLNAAVPYLYLTTGRAGLANIILDPADPFLYVGSPKGGSYIPVTAVGASLHGLIPFTAWATPSQYSGNVRGQLFVQGHFDTTALTKVPSQIDGTVTLNLDPKHTGNLFGGLSGVSAGQLIDYLKNPATATSKFDKTLDQMFHNVSIGINAELTVSPFAKIPDNIKQEFASWASFVSPSLVDQVFKSLSSKSFHVAHASLIYDGTTQSAFFHGGSINPFAGTPLAVLGSLSSLDVDAAIKPGGAFYLDVKNNFLVGGFPAQGEVLVVHNYLVSQAVADELKGTPVIFGPPVVATGAYVNMKMNLFVGSVDLTGRVESNGDFQLTATAPAHLGSVLNGRATFSLISTATAGINFTADLYGAATTSVVRGTLDFHFTLAVSSGEIRYFGSGKASVDVFWSQRWVHVGDVRVDLFPHELDFTAHYLGSTYNTAINF